VSSKHKKLGGLADIFQSESLDGAITKLPIARIRPSEDQPRRDRTHAVDELSESIRRDGLLSPIVVTKEGDTYRVIAGERRFHAVSRLGWKDVECRIISREQRDYFRIALIENLQRENLNAEEEADALIKLKKQEDLSDQELAKLVGKSRNYVTEILSIATLPPEYLEECRSRGLTQKNFLIQAVQAFRKGRHEEFLSAFEGGEIRTVRDAKDFNQERTTTVRSHERKSPATNPAANPPLRIERRGEQIIITTADASSAEQIEKVIRKVLSRAPLG